MQHSKGQTLRSKKVFHPFLGCIIIMAQNNPWSQQLSHPPMSMWPVLYMSDSVYNFTPIKAFLSSSYPCAKWREKPEAIKTNMAWIIGLFPQDHVMSKRVKMCSKEKRMLWRGHFLRISIGSVFLVLTPHPCEPGSLQHHSMQSGWKGLHLHSVPCPHHPAAWSHVW